MIKIISCKRVARARRGSEGGKLYGVGIDVPATGGDRAGEFRELFRGLNAVCTSHVASGSRQAMERFEERLSEAVRRALAGEPPMFPVTARG